MSLKDDLIKHQIFLQRLGAEHAKDISRTLAKGISLGIKALKNNPEGLNKQDLRVLHTDIIAVFKGLVDSQIGLLVETAVYEAKFLAKRLEKHLLDNAEIPTKTDLRKVVSTQKMSIVSGDKKKTIPDVYAHFTNTKASEIVLAVGDVSLQDDKEALVEDGTTKLIGLGIGLFAMQSMTLATTTTTQAASAARQEVYIENKIPLLNWVTELDSEVCPDCEALGANGPYAADDTDIPPEHWNCRCVLVPVDE